MVQGRVINTMINSAQIAQQQPPRTRVGGEGARRVKVSGQQNKKRTRIPSFFLSFGYPLDSFFLVSILIFSFVFNAREIEMKHKLIVDKG